MGEYMYDNYGIRPANNGSYNATATPQTTNITGDQPIFEITVVQGDVYAPTVINAGMPGMPMPAGPYGQAGPSSYMMNFMQQINAMIASVTADLPQFIAMLQQAAMNRQAQANPNGTNTNGGTNPNGTNNGGGNAVLFTDGQVLQYLARNIEELDKKFGNGDGELTKAELQKILKETVDPDQKAVIQDIIDNYDQVSKMGSSEGTVDKKDLEALFKAVEGGQRIDRVRAPKSTSETDTEETHEEDGEHEETTTHDNTEAEAVKWLLDNMERLDVGDEYDEDEYLEAATQAPPELRDAILKIRDKADSLTELDEIDGNLNRNELTKIHRLLEQGFTIDQLVTEGDSLGWPATTTLTEHTQTPFYSDSEDQEALVQAVELMKAHQEDIADGKWDKDEIVRLAQMTEDPKVKEMLLKIANGKDELTWLDGAHGWSGDLNSDEVDRLLRLAQQGYTVEYLIEEGELLAGTGRTTTLDRLGPRHQPEPAESH